MTTLVNVCCPPSLFKNPDMTSPVWKPRIKSTSLCVNKPVRSFYHGKNRSMRGKLSCLLHLLTWKPFLITTAEWGIYYFHATWCTEKWPWWKKPLLLFSLWPVWTCLSPPVTRFKLTLLLTRSTQIDCLTFRCLVCLFTAVAPLWTGDPLLSLLKKPALQSEASCSTCGFHSWKPL